MNRHQVLTGACNSGEQCYSVGSVEGLHFTAYAAGCNIVILASNFERVQIIPGVTHGNIKVSCIACSTDTGKIAASYARKVHIFEPTPLTSENAHPQPKKLDYRWYKTATLEAESFINCLSWNMEGSKLLTGGELIQLWQMCEQETPEEDHPPRRVQFSVGVGPDDDEPLHQELRHALHHERDAVDTHHPTEWESVWKCRPATAVHHLEFSPDGFMFASAGKADRLVKIWYEDQKVTPQLMRTDSISPKLDEHHFSFIYISHPRAVTGFSWRTTSKYMPRGSVANMLVTSCMDSVCRIWCETILPDDGLLELEQFDPSGQIGTKFHTQRHKKRFLQRLKTIRHAIHKRKKQRYGPETVMSSANLPSMGSVHDFHKFALNHNGVSPVLHFHLAGSINPETDIPLQPIVGNKGDMECNFRLHWLNNKELHFTVEAEKILHDLHKRLLYEEGQKDDVTMATGFDSEEHDPDHDIDHEYDHCHDSEEEEIEHPKKKKSKFFKRKHKNKSQKETSKMLGSHAESQTSLSSEHGSEGTGSSTEISSSIMEMLDHEIEAQLRCWHQNPDMMYSIHPIDGSFLIWLVDWLDECNPYCFRQAQVSFSSRLPNAFPIPDARSMASKLMIYCNYSKMDIKSAMKMSESKASMMANDGGFHHPQHMTGETQPATATGKSSPGQNDNMLIPNVLMLSKHSNGTINQWQISFADNSKFQTIVSVAHASRACGHRFRTNSVACHPVLPLLLTTSHHNIPEEETPDKADTPPGGEEGGASEFGNPQGGFAFCSELVLWQVDPVGPLSKSGGLVELARINAPPLSAFSNVAWVPTLLPSNSLGSYSNSPSALFVASDGNCLRLFQAIIDGRTLLSEYHPKDGKHIGHTLSFSSTTSSSYHGDAVDTGLFPKTAGELFNIASLQSSARPGCVIEMEAISDAQQDWQNIQLLHVFQEQLVTGKMASSETSFNMEAIVDLRNLSSFEENFFLVVLEKINSGGSMIHMWKITISSQLGSQANAGKTNPFMTNDQVGDDFESPTGSPGPDPLNASQSPSVMTMSFTTTKVCSQHLPLPESVDVISATIAAGHLSSASIYPACFAPYVIVTACTDGDVRFWRCNLSEVVLGSLGNHSNPNSVYMTNYEFTLDESHQRHRPSVTTLQRYQQPDVAYRWKEWEMLNLRRPESAITIPGKPITVSCAYSGRIAIAYRYGAIRTTQDHPEDKFVNLCVAIYECESTGGSEWVLEDTIELKNIKIPDPRSEIEISLPHIYNPDNACPRIDENKSISPSSSIVNLTRTKSVPSLSTIHTVKKSIEEQGNKQGLLTQKCLVQLDWISSEDGSHILTVGVASKIFTYSQVSNEIAQESMKAFSGRELKTPNDKLPGRSRPMMQKSKSLVAEDYQEEIRWMRLRSIDLSTADGLPPLPMHLSWVRAGILVVGMDNEMHVYSQWRSQFGPSNDIISDEDFKIDKRTLTEVNLQSMSSAGMSKKKSKSSKSFKSSYSMPSFKHAASSLSHSKKEMWKKSEQGSGASKDSFSRSESLSSLSVIQDYGLFEAARQANPILPQYHPKQLMELLNFGKLKRVKAILAHLVRCIAGSDQMHAVFVDEMEGEDGHLAVRSMRHHSMSANSPQQNEHQFGEEVNINITEIQSIPPLPIYALLAADNDNSGINAEIMKAATNPTAGQAPQDYTDLFNTDIINDDEKLDDTLLSSSAESGTAKRTRLTSSHQTPVNLYHFGPKQARVLGTHLMHIHLPGLSSLDQMYLMALADTVASTKLEFADHYIKDEAKPGVENHQTDSHAAESMDDCGVRFLLAMRHHIYLLGTLQPAQRFVLHKQGLKSFNLIWAFHSESTEELLSFIPSMQKGEPTWEDLKQFGAGWWITNISELKRCIEKVAKVAFQAKKDPLDAAIFYMAMKKKMVLWGLYRSVENKKMMDFFRNDFTQNRWRKAALKNAFALLGRQMFQQAAAFFLLGGSLKDAVEVCIEKLHDIQLAMVICRLYDGEEILPDSVKDILYQNILGCDSTGKYCDASKAHPDPFLRSMALWLLKDYRGALQTLLHVNIGRARLAHEVFDTDILSVTPNVFNCYNYLRTHPLLMKQKLASSSLSRRRTVMTGFTRSNSIVIPDNKITTIDRVTPMERRLFFATAHAHYKNGCPLMALETLCKLPPVVEDTEEEDHMYSDSGRLRKNASDLSCIKTGTIGNEDNEADKKGNDSNSSADFDWSTPVSSRLKNNSNMSDINKPVTNGFEPSSKETDWSKPSVTFKDDLQLELDLELEREEEDDEVPTDPINIFSSMKTVPDIRVENDDGDVSNVEESSTGHKLDIMAQQYKFIACLKVLMEELGTLATGFEVDGGQLRYQLYIWLEKESEVLRVLCNYGQQEEDIPESSVLDTSLDSIDYLEAPRFNRSLSIKSDTSLSRATLHEVILADKVDLEAKMDRMARRKQWLKSNQQFLRTLISYCILQGSGGGGLASVRMELLLLLQELQQEKPQQQLLSPLPFPTTLPLLSASIASSKTVIADPIQHLQCLSQDLLHTIIEMVVPPGFETDTGNVFLLRNLAVALSSCIYQCLCDSDSFIVSLTDVDVGLEGFTSANFVTQASHLMAGVRGKRMRTGESAEETVNTSPAKWPGVTSLRVLIAREKDEDAPKLHMLLCESLFAVYVSLLVNGLATFDPLILYRLVAHHFDQKLWSALFGGGVKTVIKTSMSVPQQSVSDDMTKQRMRLNMKLMSQTPSSNKMPEVKETYKEKFVGPELSMITYFMTKPFVPSSESIISYDSDDSMLSEDSEREDTEDEEEGDRPKTLSLTTTHQHDDPNSYTWCLIRYAIAHLVLHNLHLFLPHIGIELQELPNCSPLLHAVMKTLEQWDEYLQNRLDLFSGPPDNYIPGLFFDIDQTMPSTKYQALLNPSNTPFIAGQTTLPIKRLWFQLVKQDFLKDIFLRYIYRRRKLMDDSEDSLRTSSSDQTDHGSKVADPMKVVHKEQDVIAAFSSNQANFNCIALATQKELVELDIGAILHPPLWLEDETEYDIECIRNPNPTPQDSPEFMVVQTPQDNPQQTYSGTQTPGTPYYPSTPQSFHTSSSFYQTGRGSSVGSKEIIRRQVPGVRRIGSHPHLPHYLTGCADGSVRLWEWGHAQPLTMLRQPGTFPKVTKVLFNAQGNKSCVSDIEGGICLWQVGLGSNFNKPIMSLHCHNKTTSDFTFVGSSSLIGTAGHSSESKNICLWDTLLPQRSSLVHAFTCHEHGSPALVYAPHHQILISAGRKGEICLFDMRQRQLRHTFQAHDGPIKCLAIDPEEDYFVSGSAEGDIKVWGLDVHQLLYSFPGEHSKSTFFKNVGSSSGVTQVAIGPDHQLFSCGGDGSMKFRQLPQKDTAVRQWPS
ncbi:dmX-like protein 2 isoform X2 [Gigantopelta aegis]|uniref:dmX-like protein 2 isoform X2 n=1 Tax=Gigantopelta aegis TaxID=1735272 RepID=UPI001B88E307|nr:dmX-like protein 2 isoform X2 [Gigantopelta aegis]